MRTTNNNFEKSAKMLLALFLCIYYPSTAQLTNEDLPRNGLNVVWNDFAYFTTALPFTNVMKHSSGFRPQGDFELQLDVNGYPASLPAEQEAVNYILLETEHYPTGDYTLTWEGEGSFRLSTCDETLEFAASDAKRQTITITNACESGIILTITSTNTEDHLRNVNLYLPGHDENSSLWTDNYVENFSHFELIRFAWGAGMYARTSLWEERMTEDYITYLAGDTAAIGLPYEAMVELANLAGADLWVILPARADDDFERRMATLIRDNLDDDLSYWMEWGNEQWNCGYWGYEACDYLYETIEGTELAPPEQYAIETARSADIFIEVFSETDERDRLVTVLGGQSDNPWQLQMATERLVAMDKMDVVDVVAIGAYFAPGESYDPLTPVLDQGMDAIMDAVQLCSDAMYDPGNEGGAGLLENIAMARQHNKPFVAYEGGQHLTDWIGVSTELVAEINRHPEMYDIYQSYLTKWDSVGGGTFVQYSSYGDFDRGEAFGLKEYYDQSLSECHKFRAVVDYYAGISEPVEPGTVLSAIAPLSFQIFPNPTSDLLNIQVPKGSSGEVTITAMNGTVVLREMIREERLETRLAHLNPGMYIVHCHLDGTSVNKKLLIK